MDKMRINPHHISEFPAGINVSGGNVHFSDDGRVQKIWVVTATEMESAHHNQLSFISLTAENGISVAGLDEALGVGRQIEIIGIDGGIHTKAMLGASYSRYDTTHDSYLIKIRLTTMHSHDTWVQANDWRITLDILSGNDIKGKFTVFMPPFTLMSYSTLEVYIATDGTTYNTKTTTGFDRSLAGSNAVTEDMLNNESAGNGVVIQVTSTSGFYEGNEVFVSDSESSEWTRIKSLIPNTSITVTELTNSYTTENGAKLDIIDYIQTIPTLPVQRGITKTKMFVPDIKSGVSAHFPIPFEADPEEDVTLILRCSSTNDNPFDDVVKFCVQWVCYPMGEDTPESIQYGNLVHTEMIPPTTKMQYEGVICTIPACIRGSTNTCAFQVIRCGNEAGDTYKGNIRLIAVLGHTIQNKLGYEA